MRHNFSSEDKQKHKDENDSSFSIDLSLLTDRQRKLIELVRRDFLPHVLKDQGLLEDDIDKTVR